MVAPLVETLLLRALRRRPGAVPAPRPTRLVGRPRPVDSVGYVAERTSVLLLRPGSDVQVLSAGSLVLPALLGRGGATYAVLSHDPVDVWLRIGPFETLDGRLVQQVELRLTVSLSDAPSHLDDLAADASGSASGGTTGGTPGGTALDELDDALLDRLAREVMARTTEAVRRRTLADLTSLSLGVLLDGALPATFLGGLLERTSLEVVDVDWPTEGRGWSPALVPAPASPAGTPGPGLR